MSNPKTMTRFSRQSRPDEKILYGRSRGRSRLPFDEAVRKAEAELRAEAARVEPHCAPSVDSFSQHVLRESTSSSADDSLENYEEDFDQESEILTQDTSS